jgi:hypothetical protein
LFRADRKRVAARTRIHLGLGGIEKSFLIENLGKGKAPLPRRSREGTLQAREKHSLHEPVGMELTPQPFPWLICSDIDNKRQATKGLRSLRRRVACSKLVFDLD